LSYVKVEKKESEKFLTPAGEKRDLWAIFKSVVCFVELRHLCLLQLQLPGLVYCIGQQAKRLFKKAPNK
jgi:hypothetical protein